MSILLVAFAMVVAVAFYLRERDLKAFRRDAQTGDWCHFYHNDCLEVGEIVACDDKQVIIDSRVGTHKRLRADIYPY